jgi:hypothetical protein
MALDIGKITIEYDCPCDHGMCEHAIEKVQEAIQEAYDRGVKDGGRGAVEGLFPNEFKMAEKMATERKKSERSN